MTDKPQHEIMAQRIEAYRARHPEKQFLTVEDLVAATSPPDPIAADPAYQRLMGARPLGGFRKRR
jgi:hypothetical protein